MSAIRAVPRPWSSPDDGWSGLPAHLMDSVFQELVQSSTTGDKLPLQVRSSRFCERVCRWQAPLRRGCSLPCGVQKVIVLVAVTPCSLAGASRDQRPAQQNAANRPIGGCHELKWLSAVALASCTNLTNAGPSALTFLTPPGARVTPWVSSIEAIDSICCRRAAV